MSAYDLAPRACRLLLSVALGLGLLAAGVRAHAQAHEHPPASGDSTVPPAITAADRAAAFPDVAGHAAHDDTIQHFALVERLEWQNADRVDALDWKMRAWLGRDLDRLWLRTEGEHTEKQGTQTSQVEVLWGHAFARWWELVAGARMDQAPGPSQTWAAFGVQGLAPYRIELEATAYLGESGRTALQIETQYELLLTNRLILQPLLELDLYGKDDPERQIGSGLSTTEVGLRLRFEWRRELAPYVGVTWIRKWQETADLARLAGESTEETRWVAGLRFWF